MSQNITIKHNGSTIGNGINGIVVVGSYEVRFFDNGRVAVAYNPEGRWSWTKSVGDYDDWQIASIVEQASVALGREVQGWYEESTPCEEGGCDEFAVIVNENMNDAGAWIVPADEAGYPYLGGWERVWGFYRTREEANKGLKEAREYAKGRQL